MPRFPLVLLAALTLSLGSCAQRPVPRDQAPILHVVLVKLKNPEWADAVHRHVVHVLRATRSADEVTRGFHYDLGRPEVDGAYDIAFLMPFADRAAYEKYLRSPEHADLLRMWRPQIESLRIFDVGCERTDDTTHPIAKPRGLVGPSHQAGDVEPNGAALR
ncbi:MAG: Dabb family protein [Phycisphaerales bacterium]